MLCTNCNSYQHETKKTNHCQICGHAFPDDMPENESTTKEGKRIMEIYTLNKRGMWYLLQDLRNTVSAEIAEKLNYEIRHFGLRGSTVLQAYAGEVEESYQRAMDNDNTPDHEIGQFETRTGNPVLLTLDPDWFDTQNCE